MHAWDGSPVKRGAMQAHWTLIVLWRGSVPLAPEPRRGTLHMSCCMRLALQERRRTLFQPIVETQHSHEAVAASTDCQPPAVCHVQL